MATIQEFVNAAAEIYIKAQVPTSPTLAPERRKRVLLLGMVRAVVVMCINTGYRKVDLHNAIDTEFEIADAATRKIGRPSD